MRPGYVRFIYELPVDLDDSLMVEDAESVIVNGIRSLSESTDLFCFIHAKEDKTLSDEEIGRWRVHG